MGAISYLWSIVTIGRATVGVWKRCNEVQAARPVAMYNGWDPTPLCNILGLGFGVWGLGFRVWW